MKFFYYDHQYVEDRLLDAALVDEAMPDKERGWLRVRSSMPAQLKETSKEYYEDFLEDVGVDVRLAPTTMNDLTKRRIDLADDCIGWLTYPRYNDRQIITYVIRMKMGGIDPPKWGIIQHKLKRKHRSRQTIINHYKRGLNAIVDELNKKYILTYWNS